MMEHRDLRVTYLILAHRAPRQFARLLERLLLGTCDTAVIHLDLTTPAAEFFAAAEPFGRRVHFLRRRRNVRWGGFAMCEATMDLMAAASRFSSAYHILVSGSDYPIRPGESLRRELQSGSIYIELTPMPNPSEGKPITRLSRYWIPSKSRHNPALDRANALLQHFPARSYRAGLGTFQPHAGSQWWALPADVSSAICTYAVENRRFTRQFRASQVPDEMFFHTLIYSLFGTSAVRGPLTYARWPDPEAYSPAVLTLRDMEDLRLASTDHYFARKFDLEIDARVLDAIDDELLTWDSR